MSRNPYLLRLSLAIACVAAALGAFTAVAAAATKASPVLKMEMVSVTVGSKTVKHDVLVNGAGHAVYLLTGDSSKTPKCTSSTCLGDWPAVTTSASKPVVGKGVTGKVAIWTHKGIHQLTINGHPLYTYLADSSAAVATGNGLKSFGGTWWVLSGSGATASIKTGSGGGAGW